MSSRAYCFALDIFNIKWASPNEALIQHRRGSDKTRYIYFDVVAEHTSPNAHVRGDGGRLFGMEAYAFAILQSLWAMDGKHHNII